MCQSSTSQGPATANQLDPAVLQLVPDHPAAKAALDVALQSLSPAILNHSFRVYIYAKAHSSLLRQLDPATVLIEPVFVELHTLFVACLFHDLATAEKYDADPARFEVVGASEAAKVLREYHVREASIREAWLAMSLHTTPGIAEEISGTTGALRRAIATEFRGVPSPESILDEKEREVVGKLPRLDIEKVLGDAVVRQALENRVKAPAASWPGQLLISHENNPGWDGVNKAF
ncbi:hypothetical protein V2G26_000201 [Clonostachys chloroleuca]|uniref:HD domain-containing protein n=1 Tax=Clonostachys chloroleuca TaxID=1926264 RepID=A0AA35VLQ6_9HYPO|nr:unnamed protein product [Clonostachys chloroleuca]